MIAVEAALAEVIDVLDAGLRRMASKRGSAAISDTVVRRTVGLPIRALASLAVETPPGGEVIGWRFLLFDDVGPLWADVEGDRLVGILRGGAVERLLDACAAADDSGIEGSVAILSASSISAEALWVTGGEDRFWPMADDSAEGVGWQELAGCWSSAVRASAPREGVEEFGGGELR